MHYKGQAHDTIVLCLVHPIATCITLLYVLQLFSKSSKLSQVVVNSFSWERREVVVCKSDLEVDGTAKKLDPEDRNILMEQTLKDGSTLSE